MDRWSLLGAAVFGGVFALFGFWRIEAVGSHAARAVIAFFLFGFYCAVVIFGTAGKKRSLSVLAQTLLGITFSCAIAALLGASTEGYVLAVALGVVLGFTADWWVEHVQWP